MTAMKKILVIGLKGGVGKTTTSVSLARALNAQGIKTGILDLDYRTPNVPLAMDGGEAQLSNSFDGDVLIPAEIDGIKVMSMAYIWPDERSVLQDDDSAMRDVMHLMEPGVIDWGESEYLVCDTPPTSTGVVQVALGSSDVIGAFVVTHASRFSLMDTVRTMDLLRETGVPVFGVVINQVGMHDLEPQDVKDKLAMFKEFVYWEIPQHKAPQELFGPLVEAVCEVASSIIEPTVLEDGAWNSMVEMVRVLK